MAKRRAMAAQKHSALSAVLLCLSLASRRLLQPRREAMSFAGPLPKVATNGSWGVGRSSSPAQRKALDVTSVKRFLHLSRYPVIWKERWVGPANLDRANLRIGGMDTYALLGAVLLQVLMGLYGVISEPEDKTNRWEKLRYEAQMVFITCAVLSSAFTMIMFLLNKIYASNALSMHKDVAYALFQQATTQHRVKAFWSLIIAILSMMACFSLNLLSRIKGRSGIAISLVTMGAGLVMVSEWKSMMDLATKFIYTS